MSQAFNVKNTCAKTWFVMRRFCSIYRKSFSFCSIPQQNAVFCDILIHSFSYQNFWNFHFIHIFLLTVKCSFGVKIFFCIVLLLPNKCCRTMIANAWFIGFQWWWNFSMLTLIRCFLSFIAILSIFFLFFQRNSWNIIVEGEFYVFLVYSVLSKMNFF